MISATDQATIQQQALANGISPDVLLAVIGQESGGNAGAVSPTGVTGIAQITKDTWASIYPSGTPAYTIDTTAQITAAATLLGKYDDDYGGNVALMAVAYNGGAGTANLALKYMNGNPQQDQATAIANAAANVTDKGVHFTPDKQKEIINYVSIVTNRTIAAGTNASSVGGTPAATATATSAVAVIAAADTIAALPVSGSTISAAQIGAVMLAIEPRTLVIESGLYETPWFNNPDLVQVNGPTLAVPAPVTFQAYFENPTQPVPTVIELNASLNRFERSMKHISNRQQTRTGVLVTLWGMEPDVITGSGSTGMFANQFGITDFLSLSTLPAYIQQQVANALNSPSQTSVLSSLPAYIPPTVTGPDLPAYIPPTVTTPPVAAASSDGMRIAAKDAFMELLALFRQNGMVWFQGSKDPNPPNTSSTQLAPNAWSSTFGLSLAQMNARRNDPAARGGVILSFRGSVYYGFFSSLSWSEDADHPFRWNFNFTFKVERTSKQIFQPRSSTTVNGTHLQAVPSTGSGLQQQSAAATTGLTTSASTLTQQV